GDLRALLEEEVGLRVFYLVLDYGTSGLFAYTQVHKGCIAINRQHPAERNRWTMAHEYGHYLTSRFRADVVPYAEQRLTSWAERTADSFARNFLMPSEGVNRRFDLVYQQHGGKVTPADLLFFSRYFGVFFKAAVLRLEELHRISDGAWDVLNSQGFRVREAESILDVPVLPERVNKFPRSYVLLAITAFARALITEKQLADILTTDRLGARDTVQRVMEEAGIDDLSRFSEPLPEV
ncbi:MAG: ImmA/IrrE family metallo-endopeptidase, partial [Bacillota bacterium]